MSVFRPATLIVTRDGGVTYGTPPIPASNGKFEEHLAGTKFDHNQKSHGGSPADAMTQGEFERSLSGLGPNPGEYGAYFDRDGIRRYYQKGSSFMGGDEEVDFPPKKLTKTRGGVFVHNHPTHGRPYGNPPSRYDVFNSVQGYSGNRFDEVRVVSGSRVYSLKFSKKLPTPLENRARDIWEEAGRARGEWWESKITPKMLSDFKHPKWAEIEADTRDYAWKKLSKERYLGITYAVEDVSEFKEHLARTKFDHDQSTHAPTKSKAIATAVAREFEDEYKDPSAVYWVEGARLISEDGTVLWESRKGDETEIRAPNLQSARGGMLTHYHPPHDFDENGHTLADRPSLSEAVSQPPSPSDVLFAIQHNLSEVRVVGWDNGHPVTYRIARKGDQWPKKAHKVAGEFLDMIVGTRELFSLSSDFGSDVSECSRYIMDITWAVLADEWDFIYEATYED